MMQLEEENREMKEKLDSTSYSVVSFVSEMNSLLDHNDINAIFSFPEGGTGESDFEEGDEYIA
jgi:hypothetical protein